MNTITANDIIGDLEAMRNDAQRTILMRFFKTGKGQYGEGDEFLGIKVPEVRTTAKLAAPNIALDEMRTLLQSKWHEVRLCGLLIMTYKFESLCKKKIVGSPEAIAERDNIVRTYLSLAQRANNWDLVDLSAPKILGEWLVRQSQYTQEDKIAHLDRLAASDCMWEQRMAMVASWRTSAAGDASVCLRYAEKLLHHPHDLMHKAVGWMLREMGKRVSMDTLRDFLEEHAHNMPRTALRYAIEKMSPDERLYWMGRKAARTAQ